MPEFILDKSGSVERLNRQLGEPAGPIYWGELDDFTQGCIEALFFTEQGDGTPGEDDESGLWVEVEPGLWSNDLRFAHLAPETLDRIKRDCAKFLLSYLRDIEAGPEVGPLDSVHAKAGRNLWYTRNGHGCGFWDGDWPEPEASRLSAGAEAAGEVSAYVGDDGLIYLDGGSDA